MAEYPGHTSLSEMIFLLTTIICAVWTRVFHITHALPRPFLCENLVALHFLWSKTDDKYNRDVFKDITYLLPNLHNNKGLIVTDKAQFPAPYALYRKDKDGQLQFVRDMPHEEHYEQSE